MHVMNGYSLKTYLMAFVVQVQLQKVLRLKFSTFIATIVRKVVDSINEYDPAFNTAYDYCQNESLF